MAYCKEGSGEKKRGSTPIIKVGLVLAQEVARVTDQAIKTVTNRDNNAVTFCKCGCLRELTDRFKILISNR